MTSKSSDAGSKEKTFRCFLFVAGDEYHSRVAKKNLDRFYTTHQSRLCEVQVVDVFQRPEKALEHGIFLTPTLLKISSDDRKVLIGSLDNKTELHRFLA